MSAELQRLIGGAMPTAAADAVDRFATCEEVETDKSRDLAAQALYRVRSMLGSRRPVGDIVLALRALGRRLHMLFARCLLRNREDRAEQDAIRAELGAIRLALQGGLKNVDAGPTPSIPLGKPGPRQALLEGVDWNSKALTVATCVGLAAILAGALNRLLEQQHPFWAVTAAILIVHEGGLWVRTLQLSIERTAGTMVGVPLTAAILAGQPDGWVLVALLMLLQFCIDAFVLCNCAIATAYITVLAITTATGGRPVSDLLQITSALVGLWSCPQKTGHAQV